MLTNFDTYFGISLMVVLTILQATLVARFPIFGAVPQLLFLVALAWGLHRGTEAGLVWAFAAGFFLDLFSASPMGLNIITMMMAILIITVLQQSLPQNQFIMPIIQAVVGTLIYTLSYILLLRLFNFLPDLGGLINMPGLLLANVVVFLPVYWLLFYLRRALGGPRLDVGRSGIQN